MHFIKALHLDIEEQKICKKQAGAELGQAQVELEVIVKVGVEYRCI